MTRTQASQEEEEEREGERDTQRVRERDRQMDRQRTSRGMDVRCFKVAVVFHGSATRDRTHQQLKAPKLC